MIVDISDPGCDVVKLFNDFSMDLDKGVVKTPYKNKCEFDGVHLYQWVCKDNVQPGRDPFDVAIEEFSQSINCTSDLLTVWLKAGLISQDEFTRHYFVRVIK